MIDKLCNFTNVTPRGLTINICVSIDDTPDPYTLSHVCNIGAFADEYWQLVILLWQEKTLLRVPLLVSPRYILMKSSLIRWLIPPSDVGIYNHTPA